MADTSQRPQTPDDPSAEPAAGNEAGEPLVNLADLHGAPASEPTESTPPSQVAPERQVPPEQSAEERKTEQKETGVDQSAIRTIGQAAGAKLSQLPEDQRQGLAIDDVLAAMKAEQSPEEPPTGQ